MTKFTTSVTPFDFLQSSQPKKVEKAKPKQQAKPQPKKPVLQEPEKKVKEKIDKKKLIIYSEIMKPKYDL